MEEIRSIKIDFDDDILEINGKPYKKETIVTLPGADGWNIQKMFNATETTTWDECDCITVIFKFINNKP